MTGTTSTVLHTRLHRFSENINFEQPALKKTQYLQFVRV